MLFLKCPRNFPVSVVNSNGMVRSLLMIRSAFGGGSSSLTSDLIGATTHNPHNQASAVKGLSPDSSSLMADRNLRTELRKVAIVGKVMEAV